MQKATIVRELGETTLLLPLEVNEALRANDRAKYLLALLQNARVKAERPETNISNLAEERREAGETEAALDAVVPGSRRIAEGRYSVPSSSDVVARILAAVAEMIRPFEDAHWPEAREFSDRLTRLRSRLDPSENDQILAATIDTLTSADRGGADTVHRLVMDLHKGLLRVQAEMHTEVIDGATTYALAPEDADVVRAFMAGVNRTAHLKFEHPGLGTTATRIGDRLLIQNDIGESDAHVLVVRVEDGELSVTYSDVHPERVSFFQALLVGLELSWQDTATREGSEALANEEFFLTVGRSHSLDRAALLAVLEALGSRLVFLIDWNRARKELRSFMRNPDAVALLGWAAAENIGHRGFLLLGGASLVTEAIDMAPKGQVHYRERLSSVLGASKTRQYFEWVLRTATTGLLSNQSRILLRDEVKAELLRYFRTLDEDLLTMCAEQASFLVEVATSVEETLSGLLESQGQELAARNAVRAKRWEKDSDEIVARVRSITRRAESSSLFRSLVGVMDDAVDALEDAAFSLTLGADHVRSPKILATLSGLSQLARESAQEFLKSVQAIGLLGPSSREEEMQGFLASTDRVFSLEEACDAALRGARQSIWSESTDFKEASLALEIAGYIESSTNYLKRAAFTVKDDIFGRLNQGAFRSSAE
jgi:uncharacterized protein Yka (UPF0111/DUF47 family)